MNRDDEPRSWAVGGVTITPQLSWGRFMFGCTWWFMTAGNEVNVFVGPLCLSFYWDGIHR